MAQILVPGVAQAVLQGHIASQPWACVWHFRYTGSEAGWTGTQIVRMADGIRAAWLSYAQAFCSTSVTLDSTTCTDIGSSAPVQGVNAQVITGARTGGLVGSTAICTLAQFHIPRRYKGGHPRCYLPWGTGPDATGANQWIATYLTNAQGAMTNLIGSACSYMNQGGVSGTNHCAVCYNYEYVADPASHKYRRIRSSLQGVYTVQSYSVAQTFGTQRKRLTQ